MKAKLSGALRSKTIRFAAALAALTALQANLDSFKDILKDHITAVGGALAIIVAVLRVFTVAPLEAKAPPREPPHDDGTADDSQ